MMERIYVNNSRILAVNYFCKKAPSQIFEKASEKPLVPV